MGRKSSKLFIGMDVHKESIDIAVAEETGEVHHHGRIGGDMNALSRAVRKLESLNRVLVFVYWSTTIILAGRIASSDLLPREGRCLTVFVTEFG